MAVATKVSHQGAIQAALAKHGKDGDKFGSMAELCRSIGITQYPAQVAVREHFRKNGLGVGRGKRYTDITPSKVASVVNSTAKAEKAAAPAKKAATARKAAKASTVKPAAA